MSRYTIILSSSAEREKAINWIRKAPDNYRIEFKQPKRSTEQNARLWAMLSDVSVQANHMGRRYEPEGWKCIFMHALGREFRFVPALNGKDVIPIGLSSSDLSVAEMTELMEFIAAWGAENGVKFNEPDRSAA